MSDDYIPIDCAEYSRYELAIMHHQTLRLVWRDDDGTTHLENVQPLDLQTRNKVEYFILRNSQGETFELRLDYILRAEDI